MIDMTCGTISAAAAPWRRREPASISALTASPQAVEARVKPATPSWNVRLRPMMSPSLPPVMRSTANAMA